MRGHSRQRVDESSLIRQRSCYGLRLNRENYVPEGAALLFQRVTDTQVHVLVNLLDRNTGLG